MVESHVVSALVSKRAEIAGLIARAHDHCEARSWHGWHRHMTLCMAAAAFLARLAAQLRQAAGSKANERSPVALAA